MKSVSTVLALALLLIFTVWLSEVEASEKPDFQVIIEGGLAIPQGDLGDDFYATPLGFGATSGFEAGFRVRYYLKKWLSLSPAFHFLNPGELSSENDEVGEFSLQANSYRYSVEIMISKAEPSAGFQPFLAGAMGLYTNRYQGFTKPFVQEFDRSVHTLGYSVRAGVRVKELEFSGVYHLNRFTSSQFFAGDQGHDYNWDNVTFRAGWIIPFSK